MFCKKFFAIFIVFLLSLMSHTVYADRAYEVLYPIESALPDKNDNRLCTKLKVQCLGILYVGETSLLKTGEGLHPPQLKVIKKNFPGSPSQYKTRDTDFLKQLLAHKLENQNESSLLAALLSHPNGWSAVQEHFKVQSRANSTVLEKAYGQALLILLDTLLANTGSEFKDYPYPDRVARQQDFSVFQRALHELLLNRKLSIHHLSEDIRVRRGKSFTANSKSKEKLVRGFFLPISERIYLDYTLSVSELLYVMAHEVSHYVIFYSQDFQQYIGDLAPTISETNESSLYIQLIQLVSELELIAIDFQNRLFHASAWTLSGAYEPSSSVSGWHKSYFGNRYKKFFRPPSKRQMQTDYYLNKYPFVGGFMYFGRLVPALFNLAGDKILLGTIDDSYWSRQRESHIKHFEEKYFKTALSLSQKAPLFTDNIKVTIEPVWPVLTCDVIIKIRNALGPKWDYGVPFPYTTKAGDNCTTPIESEHPETEGSHPETEGSHPETEGSHPELTYFPSLFGGK